MSECEHEFGDYGGVYLCTLCGTVVVILGFIPREEEDEISSNKVNFSSIVLKSGEQKK